MLPRRGRKRRRLRQFASLGDQLVGVGGRTLALPLALNLLEDPHAGDVEEGAHSPIGTAFVRDAEVEGGVAHEGLVLDGAEDGPGAAGQEVGALAFLDGQAVDGAGGVVGTTAYNGQCLEAGDSAGPTTVRSADRSPNQPRGMPRRSKTSSLKSPPPGVSRPEVEAIVRDQPTTPVRRYAK